MYGVLVKGIEQPGREEHWQLLETTTLQCRGQRAGSAASQGGRPKLRTQTSHPLLTILHMSTSKLKLELHLMFQGLKAGFYPLKTLEYPTRSAVQRT